MFEVRRLRIDEQARRGRKGGTFCFLGKTCDPERATDAHRPSKDLRREFDHAGELAGATSQDHAPARLGGKWRRLETVAHHFEDFLDARLDDTHELGARDELRAVAL